MTKDTQQVEVTSGSAGEDAGGRTFSPLVDIYEEADGTTVLVAEMPGAEREDVELNVDKGVLTISGNGTRPPALDTCDRTYTGFVTGDYFRAFALSDEVDRDAIEAQMDNGLLVVRLPRAAEASTRKIEIK